MSVSLRLPMPLRELAGGRTTVELGDAASVRDVLRLLRQRFPAAYDRIVTEQGELRPHINLFVGTENIRVSNGLETAVRPGDEITVLPAVSGGTSTISNLLSLRTPRAPR